MKLFNLESGLYCVQGRCISNKIWTQITPLFICFLVLEKTIAMTLCFMHQGIFRPHYIFNNDAYILDFRAQKIPLIFFNLNRFEQQQALNFWVLNYEKQHKEGTCKVSESSVVFSAFYADFSLCPKSVIITALNHSMKCSVL